ncbi:MAG: ankyrin repeat domain-containing protein [Gammaproteobacteria bacterium]
MISKTKMTELVKEFRVREVAAGLDEKPELLAHRDEKGRNWLHLCASVNVSAKPSRGAKKKPGVKRSDAVTLAALLLDRGIDVNEPAFTEGSWQATPLWYAIGRGRNLPLARFLLKSGSTPEHCLWAASFHEDKEFIELLVDAGANLEAVAEAETPLLGAVKWSKFKSARVLLDAGADPNFRDASGMTALHYMLKKGSDKKHFRMFVEHGARGDIPNAKGDTAAAIMSRKRDPAFRRMAAQLTA